MDSQYESGKREIRDLLGTRLVFIVSFILILVVTYSFFSAVDFLPEKMAEEVVEEISEITETDIEIAPVDDSPERIVIDAIGVDSVILNPESRDVAVLDEALLSGVVHYPGSGDLEDHSNMFLFGHSSYLPEVNNRSFRAFNDLQKLKEGDLVRIYADGFEYRYHVASVKLVDASEALVELSNRERKLTLSTCNSFGASTERFVVEANFVGKVGS
jgi:LPXTG-site transpeptidase (sortase) family protein